MKSTRGVTGENTPSAGLSVAIVERTYRRPRRRVKATRRRSRGGTGSVRYRKLLISTIARVCGLSSGSPANSRATSSSTQRNW